MEFFRQASPLVFCFLFWGTVSAFAQATAPVVSTFLGGAIPMVGDGGPAAAAILDNPSDVLISRDGSLLIVDTNNQRVRRIAVDGEISTFAGTGTADNRQLGDGLLANKAQLRYPRAAAQGPAGEIYIADTNYYRIRQIGMDGVIRTVAGTGNFEGPYEGRPALQANLASPKDVAVDAAGNIYIADGSLNQILEIRSDGIVRVVAGTGEEGRTGDGGPATLAKLQAPSYLALFERLLYVGSAFGGSVRRIDLASGLISSVAGVTGSSVATDAAGNLFVASNRIQRIDAQTGAISSIAGGGPRGFAGDNGPAVNASFSDLQGLAVDDRGQVYLADSGNNRIRRIGSDGIVVTVAGGTPTVPKAISAGKAFVFDSEGLAFDHEGNLFFTDTNHGVIRKLDRFGIVTIVAGTGYASAAGDGGHPLSASLGLPGKVRFAPDGSLFFIDSTMSTGSIRRIAPGRTGIIRGDPDERISTVAGQNVGREFADHGAADGGPATRAVFTAIRSFAIDSRSNLWLVDWLDNRIRIIVPGADGVLNGGEDEIISTVAGNGVAASTGDGALGIQASLNRPAPCALDSNNNLYVWENGTGAIRRIDAISRKITTYANTRSFAPIVYSLTFDPQDRLYVASVTQLFQLTGSNASLALVAGTGARGASGDDGDARNATFEGIQYIAADSRGDIYFCDNGNFRIRRVTLNPSAIPRGWITNLSVLTSIAMPGESFSLGYVVGGAATSGAKPLLIRAAGPSLAALGVNGALDNPKIELFNGVTKIAENDDWGGSVDLEIAMSSVGAFAYNTLSSRDAASAANVPTGDGLVRVLSANGSAGRVIAEIYDATPLMSFHADTPRLINVSVLKDVGDTLVAGFVLRGSEPTRVLIRAIGPTLSQPPFNVGGAISDPRLMLSSNATKIDENNDWGGTHALVEAFRTVGAFPLPVDSKDAALVATLPPGSYTVDVVSAAGGTGIALVEIYEVAATPPP